VLWSVSGSGSESVKVVTGPSIKLLAISWQCWRYPPHRTHALATPALTHTKQPKPSTALDGKRERQCNEVWAITNHWSIQRLPGMCAGLSANMSAWYGWPRQPWSQARANITTLAVCIRAAHSVRFRAQPRSHNRRESPRLRVCGVASCRQPAACRCRSKQPVVPAFLQYELPDKVQLWLDGAVHGRRLRAEVDLPDNLEQVGRPAQGGQATNEGRTHHGPLLLHLCGVGIREPSGAVLGCGADGGLDDETGKGRFDDSLSRTNGMTGSALRLQTKSESCLFRNDATQANCVMKPLP
jgi:hypothetical protein